MRGDERLLGFGLSLGRVLAVSWFVLLAYGSDGLTLGLELLICLMGLYGFLDASKLDYQ